MMRLFLNALAASAGAGLTYVRNVVPWLASHAEVHTTVAVDERLRKELGDFPNVAFLECHTGGAAKRFWQEQRTLPRMIREAQADVLISAGNFALRSSPVPQILLSGNSLYTSHDFNRDLLARHAYGLWLDTRVRAIFAKRSIAWADVAVAPSRSFANVLSQWTGRKVEAIYHGFDHQAFFRDNSPLPEDLQQKLSSAKGHLKVLFVSHYNYYRNFETLLRAIPAIRQQCSVRVLLTCKLQPGANPGTYRTDAAARLVRELGIEKEVLELGAVPYQRLAQVYRQADIYVSPAYAETFAHPLVEAMASGIPIVAADTPVHREICGEAAQYFPTFSPGELAGHVVEVAGASQLRDRMVESGSQRSRDFSWQKHVGEILQIVAVLIRENRTKFPH